MQGYDVVTIDDQKIGQVVDERDDCLIVEHGRVMKTKHAIPKTFTSIDENERIVHATITKDVFTDGPKVGEDWDCEVVLRHYGLVGSVAEPDLEGDGETVPSDSATAADDSTVADRAAMREGTAEEPSKPAVHDRSHNALDPTGISANR